MRTLSAAARAALFAGETEQIFLCLLVIEEVGLDGPLRFVNNTESIFSRAHGEATPQEYLAWPFRLMLPDERDDQPLGPRIEIDNVDPRIMAAVRPLASPPYLTVYIVLASTPDLVEAGPVAGRLCRSITTRPRSRRPSRARPSSSSRSRIGRLPLREWPGVFR